jgi:hypothetical protein
VRQAALSRQSIQMLLALSIHSGRTRALPGTGWCCGGGKPNLGK